MEQLGKPNVRPSVERGSTEVSRPNVRPSVERGSTKASRPNVLIVGAGAVAHVAAHKCAQNNDILGNICIASRKREKCDAIIKSILRKGSLKNRKGKIYSRQIDARNVAQMVRLIKATHSSIVINLGTAYINMSVLEACIHAKVTYMD